MEIPYAVLLGIIQGLTEWLPISSSAHLAVAHRLLGIEASAAFDVALHAGTLLAVLAAFRKEFLAMVKAAIKLDYRSPAGKTLAMILIATIPGALAGYLFKDFFESLFSDMRAIGIAMILTASLLYLASRKNGTKEVKTKEALIIGLGQALAIAPGISRSGSTMSLGMLSGVEKNKAAAFSLLLSVPIVTGAAVYEIRDASLMELQPVATLAGIAAAYVVGYASIKVLLKYVREAKIQYFAYYCLVAGILLTAYSTLSP